MTQNVMERLARQGVRLGYLLMLVGASLSVSDIAKADIANPLTVEQDLKASAPVKTVTRGITPLILPDAGQMPEDADTISFAFERLKITGARAIPEDHLRRLWEAQPGDMISVADVFGYAETITGVYRNAGYALSFALVPAQAIDTGSFVIQVVEGHLEGLKIEGARVSDLVKARIVDGFSQINPTSPTKIGELERFLLLVNDLPGIVARGTISPGSTSKTSLLTLDVEQKHFDGAVSYNNFLSESLGRDVTVIDLKAFNQWTGRDALHISLKSAPDIAVYRSSSIDYNTYINDDGLKLLVSASESITQPKKGSLAALAFNSISHSNSIGFRLPWQRSRTSNVFLGGAFSTSHTTSKNGATVTSEDKLRTASLYAEYDVTHALGATSSIRFQMVNGLSVLGARGDSRANADPVFSTYDLKMRHENPLYSRQSGSLVGMVDVKLQAINSDKALLANAECGFGGRQYGVGFDAGAFSGENCQVGTARLTWRQNVRSGSDTFIGQAHYYLRYDRGKIRQKGPLVAGEQRSITASSLGVGIQLVFRNGVAFLIESSQQQKRSDGVTARDKHRTHASMNFGL